MSEKQKKIQYVVGYLWWYITAVVSIFILVESLAWVCLEFTKRPEYSYYASYMNGYHYHPYMAYHPEYYPVYKSMEEGKAPRVILTGGSTAAGIGASNINSTFFRVMENRLASEGKKISLENYAAPGLVSNQENAAYKNFIFSSKAPRLLISLTSFNDIYFYLFRPLPIGNHEFNYAFDKVFRGGYPDPPAIKERLANFARKTNFYAVFHQLIAPANMPIRLSSYIFDPEQPNLVDPLPAGRVEKAAQNFLDNALSTALMAKHRGTKYLVVLQPIIYYSGDIQHAPNQWFAEVEKLQDWIKQVGGRKKEYDQFYSLVLAGLAKMKREGLLDYLDYRTALRGDVYLDPVHFNDEANRLLGEKMAKDVKPFL